MDEHSHSNPDQVRVEHLALALELDFEARRAAGTVRLDFARIDPQAPLVLDSMALEIEGVRASDGRPRRFELGADRPGFGQPLTIRLEPQDTSVTVTYSTTAGADAVQWLAAGADRRRRAAVPVHPGPGDPDAHLDPAAGHARACA